MEGAPRPKLWFVMQGGVYCANARYAPPFMIGLPMDSLDFYTVDFEYVAYLQGTEREKRGFTRVPNMKYGDNCKPKFLCGVALQVNCISYYVPVTSCKTKKRDNLLIVAKNGSVVSSLRFNYMFPVPKKLLTQRRIDSEKDAAYRALLSQELWFCRKNRDAIQHLANRTYKRVLTGKDIGLVNNSCDFSLLEEACRLYGGSA